MARTSQRLPTNVAGDFFVDETCIDCGTCRWMVPSVYDRSGDYSRVYHQPDPGDENRSALEALIACPTASIGTQQRHEIAPVLQGFPLPITDEVFHCGYHSKMSFGATSYLIRRPEGNLMIDSPRWSPALAQRIAACGGVRFLFLTHKDDVADHARYAAFFGCERILHEGDLTGATQTVERILKGDEPQALSEDLLLIPVPGHTRGSTCLLYKNRYLFSGDHLFWDRHRERVYASKRVCWYDVESLAQSVQRIGDYSFEWLLPGHGARIHLSRSAMKKQVQSCWKELTS
jgi:glyoxylase-like metal-dependent hydrolase (beta-lactamase superfamily II)/ferredoxin